jgi:hypothetical protein
MRKLTETHLNEVVDREAILTAEPSETTAEYQARKDMNG